MKALFSSLLLVLAVSGCAKPSKWDSSVEVLLFNIHLSKEPNEIIRQLSKVSQLQLTLRPQPSIKRTAFVFRFKQHPALVTSPDSAFVSIDTSSYTAVLPFPSKKRDAYNATVHLTLDFADSISMRKGANEMIAFFILLNLDNKAKSSEQSFAVKYNEDSSIVEFTNRKAKEVKRVTFISRVVELSTYDDHYGAFFNRRLVNRVDVLFDEQAYN